MGQIARRRSPQKREFWQGHCQAWKSSGLRLKEYCQQHELSISAFGYWRRKFGQKRKPVIVPVNLPVPFQAGLQETPHSLVGPAPLSPLMVHVGGRFVVELGGDFDPVVLEKLVVSLEHIACTF